MLRFAIIDDDISIRKIIQNIIKEYGLGTVVVESADGDEALQLLCNTVPDIVLIDLLLPGRDGIEIIRAYRSTNPSTSFIMISQATSEPMITQAYEQGVEFFIHKPINVLEIISVINKVKESRNFRQMMTILSQTTAHLPPSQSPSTGEGIQKRLNKVFSDLGILGEAGTKDIYQMALIIRNVGNRGNNNCYQLYDVYQQLSSRLQQDSKTIEQRVRRAITKALHNVANMGAEDFYNDKFQTYSTALFDYKEVRLEMDHLNQKTLYRGKINVKKFIEGVIFLATE